MAVDNARIVLVRGEEGGEAVYAYLLTTHMQARKLKISLSCKTTELEPYGVVIASGKGEPDAGLAEYILQRYGVMPEPQ